MFTVIDSTTSKYRKVVNENIGSYNLNTFYTFDHVFSVIEKYLRYKTECYLGRPLIEMELPDRDKAQQDIHSSDRKKLNKNLCPRGVLLYEINPNEEDLVNIPTLNNHFAMNNGMTLELESIKRRCLDGSIRKDFDHFRDINVTIAGNVTYTSALLFYTVMLDNKIESIELMKQFKRNFPSQVIHDVYRYIMRTEDTTGKTDNTGKITEEIELIPHTLKTAIPDEIIIKLKEVFEINDLPDSDLLLEKLMKKYSFNGLSRELDGSTRKPIWFTRYHHVPILVPTSIERSDNVKDMVTNSAVRIEFQLNFIEVSAYKLRSKLSILSPENTNNLLDNKDTTMNSIIPLTVIKRPESIDECVELFSIELVYEESDYSVIDNAMKLPLVDFVESRDKYFGKYMRYLQDSLVEEDSTCYKVLIKHASSQTSKENTVYTSPGTYYSYDDLCMYDEISKPTDRIYAITYVDMVKYAKWKKDIGLVEKDNLSASLLKRK